MVRIEAKQITNFSLVNPKKITKINESEYEGLMSCLMVLSIWQLFLICSIPSSFYPSTHILENKKH
jgi:hypothetical protein